MMRLLYCWLPLAVVWWFLWLFCDFFPKGSYNQQYLMVIQKFYDKRAENMKTQDLTTEDTERKLCELSG